MATSLTTRIEQVQDFFSSGGSVCPFARNYAENIQFSSLPEQYEEEAVRETILPFAQGDESKAITYILSEDKPTHAQALQQSVRLYKTLNRVLLKDEYRSELEETFLDLERQLDFAFSPSSSINPLLGYRGKPLFSIAMNPLYTADHPRWAPCSIVVVTRHADVGAVPARIIAGIRRESKQRMGHEYDADQLYILPKW